MTCSPATATGGAGTRVGLATAADCVVQLPPGRNRPRGNRQRPRGRPNAPAVTVNPVAVAWSALDRAVALAPRGHIGFAPSRIGLTGLRSYAWLDPAPAPISATANVPGLTVYARAQPIAYRWNFGDGTTEVTHSPGRPWSRGGRFGHLYEARGTYHVTCEVVWSATWRTGSSPWRALGQFTTSATTTYPVRQMVALLVPTTH